ncbi:MAG: hypothetical protein FJ314_07445 [SAR202 cluster bacterium]|nr:hypothetical protein [SAR202 cluster bacterium]
MRILKINHQSMPIRDRGRALTFWRDLLGLEIVPTQEGTGDRLIWLRAADGSMVHLLQRDDQDRPNIHTAFEVEDFDAALQEMREAGFEIVKGPLERADGQRAFYVFDPEGNRLEFTTRNGLKPSGRTVSRDGYTSEAPAPGAASEGQPRTNGG